MKRGIIFLIIFSVAVVGVTTTHYFFNDADCVNGVCTQSLHEVLEELQSTEHAEFYPSETELEWFGQLSVDDHIFSLYISKLVNGTGNRLTKRLMVFEGASGTYLGNYGLETLPLKIEGNKVLFPCVVDEVPLCSDSFDNSITFSADGPPDEVLFDGRFHSFDWVEN